MNYGECIRHWNVTVEEHNGISPLTKKQVKPKNSSVVDQLLFCNHSEFWQLYYSSTGEHKVFARIKREPVSKERWTVFE